MRPSVKRPLRILIGIVVGAISGSLLAVCILAVFVCNADGGGQGYLGSGPPRHAWVEVVTSVAFYCSPLVPLAGVVGGVIWAIRRNRREDAKSQ